MPDSGPNFEDREEFQRPDQVTNCRLAAHSRPAAQSWIREMYGSQDSARNAAARALRVENSRRFVAHLRRHWTRPTRTG